MEAEDYLNLITLILCLMVLLSLTRWSLTLGITPTPTSPKVKASLLNALPETTQGTVYELGCGFGSLLKLLNQRYPDNPVIGIERSPLPNLVSKLRTTGRKQLKVQKKNLFEYDLENAGLIVCYLHRAAMERLAKELPERLEKDCVIVSHTFRLPGWTAEKTLYARDLYRTPVYIYQFRKTDDRQESETAHPLPASDKLPAAQAHS